MFVAIHKSLLFLRISTLYGCSKCVNSQLRMISGSQTKPKLRMLIHTFPKRRTFNQRNCLPIGTIPSDHSTAFSEGKLHVKILKRGPRRKASSYVSPSGISFHFDTHKLVKALEANGFTLEQAESLSLLFTEIISTSLGNVTSNTVSKVEQEQLEMRFRSYVDSLRNDMIMLEKSEFARIKEENAQLRTKVKSLEGLLRDNVDKLKASFSLDFSLEKSRVKEEAAVQDQKIKDTHNRIETEIAKLGTQMEAQKLDLIKYLVGSLLSCVTLGLAVWRFAKS